MNALWRYRHASGLELKQVARMLGYRSSKNLGAYESAKRHPILKNAIKLALIYGTNVNELFPDLVDKCREEIDASIKQRSFVLVFPMRLKILENMNSCTIENLLEKPDLTNDEKLLVRNHVTKLAQNAPNVAPQ